MIAASGRLDLTPLGLVMGTRHLVLHSKLASAGQRLQWGRSNPADPSTTKHVNPCASTGFWVVQPVPSVIRWLTDFIDVALYKQNEQIEQQVWNEASQIPSFEDTLALNWFVE